MIALVVGLMACGQCEPLGQVQVRGSAASDERDVLEDHLSWLSGALQPEVCIASVRVGGTPGYHGRYNSVTRQVRVASGLSDDELRRTVAHEVCHGVDLQNDIVRDAPDTWALQEELSDLLPHGEARGESEVFAHLCGLGPHLEQVWPSACTGALDQALEETRQDIYGLVPPPVAATFVTWGQLGLEELGSGYGHAEDVFMVASEVPGRLRLSFYCGDADCDTLDVDAATGEVYERGLPALPPEAPQATATPPDGWTLMDGSALATGIEVAVLRSEWVRPGGLVRLAAHDGAGWVPVLGHPCPDETVHFFLYDDGVWSVALVGDSVVWGEWGPKGNEPRRSP